MRVEGIAGALWSAWHRRPPSAPSVLFATLLVSNFTLVIGIAGEARADVEYDFTGGNFAYVYGDYTTSNKLTGDVIFPTALPPSSSMFWGLGSGISFSFSDGINSFTSTLPQNGHWTNYGISRD
jgi:hypothetical protein